MVDDTTRDEERDGTTPVPDERDSDVSEEVTESALHRMLFDVTRRELAKRAPNEPNDGSEWGLDDFPSPFVALDRFAITFSKRLLNAWVKQPSPCCAAAAVGTLFDF